MTRWLALAGLFAGTVVAPPLPAQTAATPDSTQFLDRARNASTPYRDRNRAIADGYRKIGPDFPAMGEHWVNIRMLMQGTLDPDRPTILSYTAIDGVPTLIGVAYAVPTTADRPPPPPPAASAQWHDHTGSVEDESFLPHAAGAGDGVHLSVIHAWVLTPNPDGVFAKNNWALPYYRAGITPPGQSAPDAARALSLTVGGDAFYRERFTRLPGLNADSIDAWLAQASASARHTLTSEPQAATRDDQLAAIWQTVCRQVGPACREP